MKLANKLYISKQEWRKFPLNIKQQLKFEYIRDIVNPKICILQIRGDHCQAIKNHGKEVCLTCPEATIRVQLLKKTLKGNYTIERGDLGFLRDIFKGKEIKDITVYPKLKSNINFQWSKLSNQEKVKGQKQVVKDWLKVGYGTIQAPPRSGKTVIAVAIATRLKTKVVVVTHQIELLKQFYDTFIQFTDIDKSKLKVNPSKEQFKQLDICLFTYRQFISPKRKAYLKEVSKCFGLLIVDEVHRCPAKAFSQVINQFHARYRLSLSATPTRKDGMHYKSERIMGPVTVWGMSEQLACIVKIVDTEFNIPDFKMWNTLINALYKNNKRNKLIISYLEKDLKAGHRIVVPTDRVAHVLELNTLCQTFVKKGYVVDFVTGKTPKKQRERIIQDAKQGKSHILIAMRKIVYLGLNIPPYSMIYSIIPIANKENIYQEVSRVRTPHEGKKEPEVRYFLDRSAYSEAAIACFKIAKNVYKELDFKFDYRKPDNKDSQKDPRIFM